MRKRQPKNNWQGIFIGLGIFLSCCSALTVIYIAESKLERFIPGGWGESFSTKIFGSPFILRDQTQLDLDEILARLQRLGYQQGKNGEITKGQYSWSDPILSVSLKGFSIPHANQNPQLVKLIRWQSNFWHIKDVEDRKIEQIILEPEMIEELSGTKKIRRDPALWEEFPPYLIDAVVATEDRRFFTHHGVDARSILRAAWNNLKNRKKIQGGSTITQQLAKNLFLTHRRTITRKIVEAFLAIYLDFRLTKEKILTIYLNHIYLGQDGFFSVAGMKTAARFYFDKDLKTLDLAESALLAGLIRSPYKYNPFQNRKAAENRRFTVLKIMRELNYIVESEFQKAIQTPLSLQKKVQTKESVNPNGYFVSEVIRRLLPRYSEDMIFHYGLKIYTTMDPLMQRNAHAAVQKTKHQAAVIVLSPETGRILCIIGGKNYQETQFNRATQAYRQPGSSFKPFVYVAGLINGFTPATILDDKPRAYSDPTTKKIWAPQNFDGNFRGKITFRDAFAQSINGATLDLAEKLGIHQIIEIAKTMGIISPIQKDLPTALGASEVTLLELTGAYAPFVNGGFKIQPHLISGIQDLEGNVLEITPIERTPVLDPAVSYLMTSLMESSIKEGTAKSLKALGWNYTAAGKTGTTNRGRDAWFIGYTDTILAGVWVGRDDAVPVNLSGVRDALPIWAEFMNSVYKGKIPDNFHQPLGVETAKIDPVSGFLARSGCPISKNEIFIKGTQPSQYCPIHAGGIRGWLQKIFRKKTETHFNDKSDE